MDLDHGPLRGAPSRLDRRGLLRRTAVGLAIPAAIAASNLPPSRAVAVAQTTEASPTATPPAPAATGYAPVNGLILYFEIHGTGEPLVLLHGGFATIGSMFGPLLPPLAEGRQVIAVELQAHGHTADFDRPLSFEAMADDIAALLEYLRLDRADFFGYSTGGAVALQAAIRRPEQVRKLVLASTPFRHDGWYPEVLAGMAAMDAAAMVESPLYEAYVQVAPNPDDWPTLVAKMRQLLGQEYDWTERVRSIAAPTLVVIGDSDSVRPAHALELFELLGGGVPGDFGPLPSAALAVLPQTAHSAVPFRADLLLPIVGPFLAAPMPTAR